MYDKLGHPTQVTFTSGNTISYVYAADGRKLRSVHRQGTHQPVTTDYAGPYEFTEGTISRVSFPGGYYSYSPNRWTAHYYIQDYQGSNRKVVKVTSTTVEQVTHYYPYGGVIGDISTQEGTQKYKFEGKELDRSFGLDNYDIHARNYYAMLPMWDRVDPLAEKYYGISPYVYCAGDPVNQVDQNGENSWKVIGKALYKVGKTVAKKGVSSLKQGATYAEAFSDLVDDVQTLTSSESSVGEKALAVVSLASEIVSPVSVKDVKQASHAIGIVHGNSKASTKAQHVYRIFDKDTGKTVKVGISVQGKNKAGKSKRAQQQVNKMNKRETRQFDSEIMEEILEGEGARIKR